VILVEIGDRARDPKHAVKRARREAETLGGGCEELASIRFDRRRGLKPSSGCAPIRVRPPEWRVAHSLAGACTLDTSARVERAFALIPRRELANGHRFHGNIQ